MLLARLIILHKKEISLYWKLWKAILMDILQCIRVVIGYLILFKETCGVEVRIETRQSILCLEGNIY